VFSLYGRANLAVRASYQVILSLNIGWNDAGREMLKRRVLASFRCQAEVKDVGGSRRSRRGDAQVSGGGKEAILARFEVENRHLYKPGRILSDLNGVIALEPVPVDEPKTPYSPTTVSRFPLFTSSLSNANWLGLLRLLMPK